MKTKRKYLVSVLFMLMLCLLCGAGASAAKVTIRLNKTKATIYTSGTKTVQLKATVTGTSSKVTWKSSNSKVATVSSSGKVTAQKAGTVTITAKAGGKTASCTITVKKVDSKAVSKAYAAYVKKNLSSSSKYPESKYTLYDINGDGIKEMFFGYSQIYNNYTTGITFRIYTYTGGKVKKMLEKSGGRGVECWCNSGKKQVYLRIYGGMGSDDYFIYQMKENKLVKTGTYARYLDKYYKNGKKISSSTFNKFVKSLDSYWNAWRHMS